MLWREGNGVGGDCGYFIEVCSSEEPDLSALSLLVCKSSQLIFSVSAVVLVVWSVLLMLMTILAALWVGSSSFPCIAYLDNAVCFTSAFFSGSDWVQIF